MTGRRTRTGQGTDRSFNRGSGAGGFDDVSSFPDRYGGGAASSRRRVRCAVYTRKSSEEGLEQAFNSLHAQREACEAYIRSQQHEGWVVLPTAYDDGGFSGGTMERPALRRLLADIRSDSVDVVVVYKIDRLTRSLFDFAKIVETFDAAQASFVSITQSFNTTTSMGRLTLNVLLSFAQFEREVTGERIRDKIAASKRKGMWMGGTVPLGYDLKDRKLGINRAEAETVRLIFQLYRDQGTVRAVKAELDRRGLRTKVRAGTEVDTGATVAKGKACAGEGNSAAGGRTAGGRPFGIGHLHTVLRNPLYVGMIRHKGDLHPGAHEVIVPKALWRSVQKQIDAHAVDRMSGQSTKAPSLLTGRIADEAGNRLTPSHAVKGAKRYRYYVTGGRDLASNTTLRLPATDIETVVVDALRELLTAPSRIADALSVTSQPLTPATLRKALDHGAELAAKLANITGAEAAAIVRGIGFRVVVSPTRARIIVDSAELANILLQPAPETTGEGIGFEGSSQVGDELNDLAAAMPNIDPSDDHHIRASPEPLVIERTIALRRQGREQRLILTSATVPAEAKPDAAIIKALVRARIWFAALKERRVDSIAELGRREGLARTIISHHLPLAFLAPDITEAVIDGRQPVGLTLERLVAIAASPAWDRQRALFSAG